MGAVDIAAALSASRRAVRLYPPEHPAHREALRDLLAAVGATVDVRPLVLNLRDGRLYDGSDVLTEASPATRALVEAMEARRVESLTFHMGFTEADGEGISEVLSLRPSPDLQVQAELEARGVRGVTVSELEDNLTREAEERDRRREMDRSLYRQSLTALKFIVEGLSDEGTVESVGADRAIAMLIERVADEPQAVLALASMTGHGDREHFHAVSVMLYSLVLGSAIGLPDKTLLELGLAALVHDIGRMLPPLEGETNADADHTVRGAYALGSLVDEDCLSMIVAFEHHWKATGSDESERSDRPPHPFARIVAIADRYDNLIRPPEGTPLRPDEAAARLLLDSAESRLDPDATRLFVKTTGVIPVCSTVRLSDHSVGIVSAPGGEPLRPRLRLVLAPDGTRLRQSLDVDLVEDGREIVQVVEARYLDLQPSDYL